jgi:hypothetical protein
VLAASYGWTLNMPFGMRLEGPCRACEHMRAGRERADCQDPNLSVGALVGSAKKPNFAPISSFPARPPRAAPSIIHPPALDIAILLTGNWASSAVDTPGLVDSGNKSIVEPTSDGV